MIATNTIQTRTRTRQLGSFPSFLGTISMAWKMASIIFVLFMSILIIMFVSWLGLQTMQFHVSNLYDFMLIPISSIKDADIALTEIQSQIYVLEKGLDSQETMRTIQSIHQNEAIAESVMARYNAEWVTTTSPEFTEVLRNAHRLDLQAEEAITLESYRDTFEEYKIARDSYLAAISNGPNPFQEREIIGKLRVVRMHLERLIDINIEFADISDRAARSALSQALTRMVAAMAIGLSLSLVLSYLIVTSITNRLHDLIEGASIIQQGSLDHLVTVDGKDEISLLGSTFNSMAIQLKNLIGNLEKSRYVAEEATKTKSLFLANMSHELRTPLSVIISHSELLEENAEELGYEILIPKLERIRTSGNHLQNIINNLLDLSKMEANKMEFHLETFKVYEMVEELGAMLHPIIEKKGNELTIYCPTDLGMIHVDLTKLRQTLFNLMDNAAKFTSRGYIYLSVSREINETGSWIIFEIRDTGIGLTSDQIKNLFQEFTQADPSITRNYGGTGLGLALSRDYCQMMGGDILVSSPGLGKGSTFQVRLPAFVDKIHPLKKGNAQ